MSLSLGIVGLPNVGKSTLFNALTKNNVLAANYPFATIEPNVGVVSVPDSRLEQLSAISQSAKTVPAIVSFTDIAGIVRGAAEGAGLGNKFLSHIRECHAIVQVVRAFEGDIVHVDNHVDPIADIATINTELILADIETLTKRIEKLEGELKANPKVSTQLSTLQTIKTGLDQGKLANSFMSLDEYELTQDLQLLTTKPFIIVYNLSESQLSDTDLQERLRGAVSPTPVVFLAANVEAELQDMPSSEAQELLNSLGQTEAGLDALIRLGYETLGLQSFYTSGPTESKAWTIRAGSTAPQAAGVIHTDFEKGFIRAETTNFEDFITYQGWTGCKEAGKIRLEGKDYIMQDGDVVLFRFNT